MLIVGDTVLGKITPHIGWMLEPADPLGQFLDSLEKVAQLEPSLVLPGHGRPFDEGAERARVDRVAPRPALYGARRDRDAQRSR